MSERVKMEKYLEEKYGKEFVVDNVRVQGAGIGVDGELHATATLQTNTDITFDVRGGAKGKNTRYDDDFLTTLWSSQAREKAEVFIQKELEGVVDYSVDVQVSDDFIFNYPMFGQTIDLYQALSGYPESISAYILSVRSIGTEEEEPSGSSLEKAFKIVSFAKEQPFGNPEVYYLYKNSSYNQTDESGKPKYQFRISVAHSDLMSVSSPDDLRKYFDNL
jgi:hypothetical protein